MGILLAFAPFLAFAVVDRLFGSTAGLIAGAVTSGALVLRDRISRGRPLKILEVGTRAGFLFMYMLGFVCSVFGACL